MMKKNTVVTALWITLCIAILGAIALGVGYFTMQGQSLEYKNQLEYVYERSFYELVDNVNNIEINLSKLSASKSDMARKEIIAKIISQSNMAQNNLAVLPIDVNEIGNTVSFVNYVNGYLTSLNQKLGKGNTLNQDDLENIENLYDTSKKIKAEVNDYAVLMEGDYKIIDNAQSSTYELSRFSQTFSTLKEPSVDYPQLIYDGPFSDSVVNKEVKNKNLSEISRIEADKIVESFKKDLKFVDFEFNSEGKGNIPTLNYNLNFKNNTHAYLQLTKNGGKVLSYSRDLEERSGKQEQDKYISNAIDFAQSMGYENMESVWIEHGKDGNIYINLVYKMDNIPVYPDMIKVKLTTATADIAGFEASSYFYNHMDRISKKPLLSIEKAQENLPSEVNVLEGRLVVIPGEYVGELYAYEFNCEKGDNTFYIYIDADSGEQVNIMRVIQTDNGELLM